MTAGDSTASVTEPFAEIGRRVEHHWRRQNYDTNALPSIAADALSSANLPSRVDPWTVAEWASTVPLLPPQQDVAGRFSDLPITVFDGGRFFIDVYFWLDGTTAIHAHAFGGAFQVLSGSSLHSTFDFDIRQRVNGHLAFGDLTRTGVEVLRQGEVRRIEAGPSFIHSLFHLDRPSVSVVVRNDRDVEHQPQLSYSPAGLAFDPFFNDRSLTKRLQTLQLVLAAGRPDADDLVARAIQDADRHSAVTMLSALRPALHHHDARSMVEGAGPDDRFGRLLALVGDGDGDGDGDEGLAHTLRRWFEQQDRTEQVVGRRRMLEDPDLRFLLALTANLDRRQEMLPLVHERVPHTDPFETLLDWVAKLGRVRQFGNDVNALGLADYTETDLVIVEELMSGTDPEAVPHALGASDDAARVNVVERVRLVRESPVLAPLLRP